MSDEDEDIPEVRVRVTVSDDAPAETILLELERQRRASGKWPARNQRTRLGKTQRGIWRALVAAGRDLSTSELMPWSGSVWRTSVLRAAQRVAVRVSRRRHGEHVWRLREGHSRPRSK